MTPAAWYGQHDPNLGALRRAGRTAILMPALFAFSDKVIGKPVVASFASFGAFAMLLLVGFSGPVRDRLQAQAALAVAGAVLITVATLASRIVWLAVVTMAIIGFGVIFVGVVSSVLASASTSLLLASMLAVTLPGRVSSLPDRLAGWGLASAVSLVAIVVLWPLPARDALREAVANACRALAERLRSEVAFMMSGKDQSVAPDYHGAVAGADAAVGALHSRFLATPDRPTSLNTSARTVVRLVDEVIWLGTIVAQCAPRADSGLADPEACRVKVAVAEVLDRSADLLEMTAGDAGDLTAALAQMSELVADMEHHAMTDLPAVAGRDRVEAIVTSLDPRFRARELSFAVALIASNVALTAAAERRTWLERLMGRQPEGLSGTLRAAGQRAAAHAERHSVWLRNSVRGAVGLALAVAVAHATGVQHAFWVLFGSLSVLRSNALSTGQQVARALAGAIVGFAISAAILSAIDGSTTVLWVLLPFAVLVAGIAPAAISFTAGQAAFTATMVILFNIIQPAGWRIGLVRVEDVALGCAVSLVVGLLFWPRGATAALRQALAAAYQDSAAYLAGAVEFGMSHCDLDRLTSAPPTDGASRAAAASRRLDDTFRNYLAERGVKRLALAEVTTLVNGVAGLRLAGEAVTDLWQDDDGTASGDRAVARRELEQTTQTLRAWYDDLAASLITGEELPDPQPYDDEADQRLVDAVSHDLRGADGKASATAIRMIWTGDHLDAVRRFQSVVLQPVRAANGQRRATPKHPA